MKKICNGYTKCLYLCDGCSTAPLTQYKNNEIYQEITERWDYGDTTKDDHVYIDMRRSNDIKMN